jgi:branched-chain amino acid transport system permease protein
MSTVFILQLLLDGIAIGMIYALIAVGLSLIFGVLEVVNFAHGQIYMLGAFAAALAISGFGLGYVPAVIAATAVVALAGYALYEGLLRFVRQGEFERGIILTLGIGIVVQNGMIYLFGATPRIVDTEFSFRSLEAAGLHLDMTRGLAVVFAAAAIAGLHLLLTRTRFGKAMRAMAQNREAAFIVGMRPRVVAGHAVIIGLALAGLAGAILAPVFTVHPLMGVPVLFKAFAIVIIGGLGHIPGAALAGVLVGVCESFAGGLGSAAVQDAVVFLLMILILQWRPMGLFGRGVRI